MTDKTKTNLARLALLCATLIWGSSFYIMKGTLDDIDVFWLLAIRFLSAAAVLAAVFAREWKKLDRSYIFGGAVMGAFIFGAYSFQTYGLKYTTPGNNAFLTASYCIIVPFLYWAVKHRPPDAYNITSAVLCLAGIGCVSLTGGFSVGIGDGLTLCCGFFYAAHIIAVAHFAQGRSIFLLTIIQFATSGLLSLLSAVVIDGAPRALPASAYLPLIYLCLFATAAALLLQNVGQKYTSPSSASIILSLESVFGAVFSIALGGENPSPRVIIGFALIFIAIIVSEVKPRLPFPRSSGHSS